MFILPFARATVVPDGYPLTAKSGGGWNEIEAHPSPELLIAPE